jgi:Protein of unknown function (DUF992)
MRWWMVVVLPVCAGFGMAPGAMLPVEIGVLSCTLGRTTDPQVSDKTSGASETREMLCTFSPARNGPEETYAGALKSINTAGPLPDSATLLWMVRAPVGAQATPGLLQQSYSADPATPAGQTAPLVGERTSEITLHTMSDKEEGSASKEKQSVPRFVITGIELKLKATAS